MLLSEWKMHLDERAAFPAFFLFCRVRRFCLTVHIFAVPSEHFAKKKKKNEID